MQTDIDEDQAMNDTPTSAPPSPAGGRAQPDIASFVLRFAQDVWREAGGEPRVRWRGHIRHVQSDAEARFTDFADAVAFIQGALAKLTMDSVAGDSAENQAQAMTDSLRLWERFTADYAGLVARSMEQTLRQTQDYQRQVGENLTRSFSLWNPLMAGVARAADPAAPPPAAPPAAADPDAAATSTPPTPTATASPTVPAAPTPPDSVVLDALVGLQAQIAALAGQVERLEAALAQGAKGNGKGKRSQV
jgi:hypothetical protein